MPDQIRITPRRMCADCEAMLGYSHTPQCAHTGVVRFKQTTEKWTTIEKSDLLPPKTPADAVREFAEAAGKIKTPRQKSELALGKAVHPAAIARLYEIFPDAEVQVLHGLGASTLPEPANMEAGDAALLGRYNRAARRVRYTTVTVSTPNGDVLANTAWFYPPVQFSRRVGIAFAFRRLLKDISMRTNEANRALGID